MSILSQIIDSIRTPNPPPTAKHDPARYVVGFVFCQEAVLLIRKARPKWQAGKLNGVGGKIEPGELPLAAMVRECREESGLEIPPHAWNTLGIVEAANKDWQVTFFSAEHTGPLDNLTACEDEPVKWFWIYALDRPEARVETIVDRHGDLLFWPANMDRVATVDWVLRFALAMRNQAKGSWKQAFYVQEFTPEPPYDSHTKSSHPFDPIERSVLQYPEPYPSKS